MGIDIDELIIKDLVEKEIDMILESFAADIKFEIQNNPCILDSSAFLSSLTKNYKDFIQANYRD